MVQPDTTADAMSPVPIDRFAVLAGQRVFPQKPLRDRYHEHFAALDFILKFPQ